MKQPWYGDNEHRDYPFITRADPSDYVPDVIADDSGSSSSASASSSEAVALTVHLPQELIVDAGAITEVDSDFLNRPVDYIYLHSIERVGNVFLFRLRITPVACRHEECVFTRDLHTVEEFEVEWAESQPIMGSAGAPDAGCQLEPKWRGFLVTGAFDDLVELLPGDGEMVFARGLWRYEPARIQTLANTYLRSISLANYPRNMVTPVAGCGPDPADTTNAEPIIMAECLTGDLQLTPGFNSSIRQETQNGVLLFGAGVGAGEGEPCGEIPLSPHESPPAGSPFLTGGPGCDQILMTINGVGGRNLKIIGGFGITVTASQTAPHTIVIAKDTTALAVCPVGT